MKNELDSVEVFIDNIEARQEDIRKLDKFIVKVAPHLKREILDAAGIPMIGYGELIKDKKGSKIWPLIGVASKSNYISIFVAGEKEGIPLPQIYDKDKLGKVNNGKKCIRFKNIDDLNLNEMENLIKDSISWREKEC